MSFAALKKNRPDLSKLVEQAQQANGSNIQRQSDDPRFWMPTRDKAGNGYAVIRFLPGIADAATPWTRYWDHAFKGSMDPLLGSCIQRANRAMVY